MREGALQLLEEGDPDRAHEHAAIAIRTAQAVGSIDLEMLGRALQGLALVTSGAVAEGMAGLDEVNAAIVAGELKDLIAIGLSCCYMIAACDRVRDYDRAAQWCVRLKAFCAKWGLRPLFAVCRTQYASICMWRGTWVEAEEELTAATGELAASRPAMTADGLVRLAELRRRQGRLTEAAALFDQSDPHPLAALGRATLAYDGGDPRAAAEGAERYLRRVLPHNRIDRAAGLDLLVPANYAIPAHSHPTDENVVITSGGLTFGMGEKLSKTAAGNKTLGAGGFALMPANMNHFAYTAQETTVVLYGVGPVEFKYVNPADDPRNAKPTTK